MAGKVAEKGLIAQGLTSGRTRARWKDVRSVATEPRSKPLFRARDDIVGEPSRERKMSTLGGEAVPASVPTGNANLPVVDGVEERLPEWQVDHVYCWDDTAQQVCPADPRVVENLQRQGHFILGLTSAFRTKLGLLQNSVNGPLLAKRDALLLQQAKIQSRIDEVKAASASIEKETKLGTDEIVERLRSTERFKLSLLLRDKVDLGKDVEMIQGLVEEVAERGKAISMIDFLGKEKHLKDRCEMLVGKPYKREIEVLADDFERESRGYKDVVKKYKALQELVEVKDTIIAQLLEDRAVLQKKVESMEGEQREEIRGLQKEKDDLAQALASEPSHGNPEGDPEGKDEVLALTETPRGDQDSQDQSQQGSGSGDDEDKGGDASLDGKKVVARATSDGSGGQGSWLMTIEHNGKRIEVYQEEGKESS